MSQPSHKQMIRTLPEPFKSWLKDTIIFPPAGAEKVSLVSVDKDALEVAQQYEVSLYLLRAAQDLYGVNEVRSVQLVTANIYQYIYADKETDVFSINRKR